MRVQSTELDKIVQLFKLNGYTVVFESLYQWYVVEFDSDIKFEDVYGELKAYFAYRLVDERCNDKQVVVKFEMT